MKEKLILFSADEISIILEALTLFEYRMSMLDSDTYLREMNEKLDGVSRKLLV